MYRSKGRKGWWYCRWEKDWYWEKSCIDLGVGQASSAKEKWPPKKMPATVPQIAQKAIETKRICVLGTDSSNGMQYTKTRCLPGYSSSLSHGVIEKAKQEQMKLTDPKKSFLIVEERKEEIFQQLQLEYRDTLHNIVAEFKEVFPDRLPKEHTPKMDVDYHIETIPEAKPPSWPPYWLGPAEQDEMEKQIKDLVEQRFIRPSVSPCDAPTLFVPKKDRGWRMCMDDRVLNKTDCQRSIPSSKNRSSDG